MAVCHGGIFKYKPRDCRSSLTISVPRAPYRSILADAPKISDHNI